MLVMCLCFVFSVILSFGTECTKQCWGLGKSYIVPVLLKNIKVMFKLKFTYVEIVLGLFEIVHKAASYHSRKLIYHFWVKKSSIS